MSKQLFQTSLALAKANFKLRNEGNYLGILWYLLDPLLFFLMFVLVRNILGTGIEYYPVYLLIGLTMFNFFRKTTTYASRAISSNAGIISNLKIKSEVFVISSLLLAVFSHIFELALIAVVMFFMGLPVWYLIFYPFIFFFLWIFTLGFSFLVSSISVYLNDFSNLWGIITRVLWFTTPIFYSARLELPFEINTYNPMYYYLTMAREVLIYHRLPETWMIVASITVSFVALIFGIFIFQKTKHGFAEKL